MNNELTEFLRELNRRHKAEEERKKQEALKKIRALRQQTKANRKANTMGQAKQRGSYQERIKQAKEKLDKTYEQFYSAMNPDTKTGLFILYEDNKGGRNTWRTVFDRSLIPDIKRDLAKKGVSNKNDYSSALHILFEQYHQYFSLDMMTKGALEENTYNALQGLTHGVIAYLSTFKTFEMMTSFTKGLGIIASARQDDAFNPNGRHNGNCVLHDGISFEEWDTLTAEWQTKIGANPEFVHSPMFDQYMIRNQMASQARAFEETA